MARTKTYKFGPQAIRKIVRGMSAPIRDMRSFFNILGVMLDTDTKLTFMREGTRSGNPRWRDFSPGTLRTRAGTYNIRYGTDLRGRPRGTYIPFKKRPGIRRYSSRSKLLQASGSFKRSFGVKSVTKRKLDYGTVFELAEEIIGKGRRQRQVLFITPGDEAKYARRFAKWWFEGMTF